MRIVHVVYGFDTGGMEKGVATLARCATPGIEHVVVCLDRSGASARLLPENTRVIELHKRPGHSLIFLLRLARTLRQLQPTIVHTRNWGGLDGVIACRLAGIRGVIHGEHGWTMDDPHGRSSRRIRTRRFLDRWIREFTCVSREMESWLRSTVRVRAPVTQIYNGVDTDVFCPASRRGGLRSEIGIPHDSFVVTICGRLDPIKDHVTLFRAIRVVRDAGISAQLLVVGDGPERARLEREASEGVRFLGNRGDVPDILRDSDLFALTSLNEGISNTILEAMATGLPVVATNVGGNPELVVPDVTGALVPPGDSDTLARALLAYAAEPERVENHGKAGRERAKRDFSVQGMVRAYETAYVRTKERSR